MTPALERLAELVRQAETKSRARKIEGEAQHAAEQFRAAELRARRAAEQLRQLRPASVRALEQADLDEARPTAVIIALVRMARKAERMKTAAGMKEARLALREAQRLHMAQTRERHDIRLTVLDDDEYDAIFRSVAVAMPDGAASMAAPPMIGH